jgi:peptide/nickel transport system permease protein
MSVLGRVAKLVAAEVAAKSLVLVVITTFGVYVALSLAPKGRVKTIPVRGSTLMVTAGDTLAAGRPAQRSVETAFPVFYFVWLGNAVFGRLGYTATGQPIAREAFQKFSTTLVLSLAALIPALVVSFLVGFGLARPEGRERVGWLYSVTLATSLPAFVLGYFLWDIHCRTFVWAVLTLGLSSGIVNEFARAIRATMAAEFVKPYIETARVKGLRSRFLPLPGSVEYHAFRNGLVDLLPKLELLFPFVVGGSIVVEQVFGVKGLSYMLFDGLADGDVARILSVILLVVVLVRVGAITSSVLRMLLDPKYGENVFR